MAINNISNSYCNIFETIIRNKNTDLGELRMALLELGKEVGKAITANYCSASVDIITPMGEPFRGLQFMKKKENVIMSTKDDYSYFAKGISEQLGEPYQGYIDFSGMRGLDLKYTKVLGESISLPEIVSGNPVGTVIIAKSVIATGCTAATLAREAYAKYMPSHLIIAGVFYSDRGMDELIREFPNVEIYVVAQRADIVDSEGMLHPGVGNIDERICG